MKRHLPTLPALLVATLLTAALASVVQTQVNLAQVARLGGAVDAVTRIGTTLEDLARFGPVMAGIALVSLLLALPLAALVGRRLAPGPRGALLALAGAAGLWAAFAVIGSFSPMPALVAATGTPAGLLAVCLSGLAGGAAYAVLAARLPATRRAWPLPALLALAPVLAFVAMAPGTAFEIDRADPADYRVQVVATGLDSPWSLAFLPDGRTLVTERAGRLLAIGADGASVPIALGDLPPVLPTGGAQLMSLAVDPDFARTGWLFLTMGHGAPGANGTRLVRARLAEHRLVDVRILFDSTPKVSPNNNGGALAFLPDGTLVMSVGDGERRAGAQDPSTHFGKLIRLERDGSAPAIHTLGHRNPQGLAFDPVTSALLATEHGPRGGDELNRVDAGANYGWPVVTDGIDYSFARVTPFAARAGFTAPLLAWTPSIAPAGLAVVDGALFAHWRGDLLVPALKERGLRRIIRDRGRIVGQQLLLGERGERLRDVKVAPDGAIVVLTDGPDARLLRLVPAR